MRISSAVIVILVLARWVSSPAVAQNAARLGSLSSRPAITSVSVADGPGRVDVEVAFTALVQPEVSRLEHPDRLVFDFPGCDLAGPGQRFVVNNGSVVAVNTATVGALLNARVVIELRSEVRPETRAKSGSARGHQRETSRNKLIVSLSSNGNNLTIKLSETGNARNSAQTSPAAARQGDQSLANSQSAPKPDRESGNIYKRISISV
jgi:hypothetical protein